MKFLPELRSFLREHKVIYTVRGYRARNTYVVVEDVGRCRRILCGVVSSVEDLRPYVELSGFDCIENWWSKIEDFIIPGDRIWLYRVEMGRKEIKKCLRHKCYLEIDRLATFLQRRKVYFCQQCELERMCFFLC